MTEWPRDYAMLALRINRLIGGAALSGGVLIYRGPEEWGARAGSEPPAAPGKLADDAERLLESAPTPYLAAHVRAMRAVARYLDGERPPLAAYARECLGLEPRRLPEEVFEEAHAELDAALPKGPGPLADRLRAWQAAHTLEPIERLPALVAKAVTETRARTNAIVPLPEGEVVGCRLVEGVSFHGAGAYEGELRSTIHINKAIPYNLADLLYLVAHEGHPGHIAESMLKELHLADRRDQEVRFMVSPSFVLSEGLGLLAEEILFPGDEAQVWLNRHIFPDLGIRSDGSDFAAIHHAKNVLWGVWGNVAFLADEGRPDADLVAYLTRWALYSDEEAGRATGLLKPSPTSPYIFGYFHGWELLRPWAARRAERVRRLLTEQLLPADVTSGAESDPGADPRGT
ncbi:hypothetical protein [Nonomuraea jiangxiensis]|uniref:DUF885 domain-containing protein n=1 Tax=Nonomuraea jiangxiensis TaxID=633440 RepID=A0A1G9B7N2_9ACTN|nr:hypothetical protein [Nonomuraea jiangxiensis]SDK35050.1 hypothetical protein SAMN05421869_115169 [Nonomuraea jiangxiensis]